MKIECRVCGRATDAFLCYKPCTEELEQAFGDLPGLVADVITTSTGEANAYRYGDQRSPDDDKPDTDPAALIRRTANVLLGWARHLAEARGVPLVLDAGRHLEGPACPAHAHDFRIEGCGLRATPCKQINPRHVHDYTPRGCAWDRDPETGEPSCTKLHCDHETCAAIRAGQRSGTAATLVRWFLKYRTAIRYDEAAAEIYDDVLELREEIRRFVDRTPAPFFSGPCHAKTPMGTCQRDLYAWINPFAIDPRDDRERPTVTCDGYGSRVEADTGCGTIHTLADRYEWLLDSVEDALLPLATWQAALPKLFPALSWPRRETWWRWAFGDEGKRRLFAKSIDRAGVELFRGGDIVELVRAEQARIKPKSGKIAS